MQKLYYLFFSADLLVRAARHYEGAFQIQVRKAVATARQVAKSFRSTYNLCRTLFFCKINFQVFLFVSFQFIKLTKGEPVPINTWVTAEAPG